MPIERADLLMAFRFQFEMENLIVAGFSEVTGLEAENEMHVFREGGVNEYEHQFFTIRKYPRLVLKRGFTVTPELWRWYKATTSGQYQRKTCSVILTDASGVEKHRWSFLDSYPVKWIGPQLSAGDSKMAIESLEIIHRGFIV